MESLITSLNDIVWSMALVALCLGLGLYFSIRTRFMQVRGVPEMLRLMLNNKSSTAGVSSFQALAMSLAGRVGTGNIAGVATAIAFGGPGAVPLVLAGGPGSASRATICVVVIFGVAFSTLLSLFIVPAFYVLLARYTRSPDAVGHELEKLEAETPQVGGNA